MRLIEWVNLVSMTTQTKVPPFLKIAFECINPHYLFFIKHFGITTLRWNVIITTAKVDCVICQIRLLLRKVSFPNNVFHFSVMWMAQKEGTHLRLVIATRGKWSIGIIFWDITSNINTFVWNNEIFWTFSRVVKILKIPGNRLELLPNVLFNKLFIFVGVSQMAGQDYLTEPVK